jgi:hypothetical protein
MGSVARALSGSSPFMRPRLPGGSLSSTQAVCDWPACAFAKELIEAYPEAKVILTTRDVDSWYRYYRLIPFDSLLSPNCNCQFGNDDSLLEVNRSRASPAFQF